MGSDPYRVRLSPFTGIVPNDVDRFCVEEVDITNGSSAAAANVGNTKLLTTFPNLKSLRLFGLRPNDFEQLRQAGVVIVEM